MKREDLTGMKFGKLTVKYYNSDYIIKTGKKSGRWMCECDCGNPELIPVFSGHLKDGHTTSCGKCSYNDLTGQTFGNWKVLKRVEDYISPKGNKIIQWLCECQCNNKTLRKIRADILKRGDSKSCGCLQKNKYDLTGEYGIGWTLKNQQFYFDLEDYDKIKDYTWHYDKDKYVCACCKNPDGTDTTIKMHRIIMNLLDEKDLDPDHIKHINYDNRKSQLRIVTQNQNNYNTKIPINNTSGCKGVSFNKEKKKYEAYIKVNKKKICLGYFSDLKDAIKARKEAEEKYCGEFSYDNSMKLNNN